MNNFQINNLKDNQIEGHKNHSFSPFQGLLVRVFNKGIIDSSFLISSYNSFSRSDLYTLILAFLFLIERISGMYLKSLASLMKVNPYDSVMYNG